MTTPDDATLRDDGLAPPRDVGRVRRIAGGALGLALARLGLWGGKIINQGRYDQLVSMDTTLMTFAILTSLVVAIIAGLYPTWRIGQISPATYLKT